MAPTKRGPAIRYLWESEQPPTLTAQQYPWLIDYSLNKVLYFVTVAPENTGCLGRNVPYFWFMIGVTSKSNGVNQKSLFLVTQAPCLLVDAASARRGIVAAYIVILIGDFVVGRATLLKSDFSGETL